MKKEEELIEELFEEIKAKKRKKKQKRKKKKRIKKQELIKKKEKRNKWFKTIKKTPKKEKRIKEKELDFIIGKEKKGKNELKIRKFIKNILNKLKKKKKEAKKIVIKKKQETNKKQLKGKRIIKTNFDLMLAEVNEKKIIGLKELAKKLKVKEKELEEDARILEEKQLIEIIYPLIGEIKLKKIEKK